MFEKKCGTHDVRPLFFIGIAFGLVVLWLLCQNIVRHVSHSQVFRKG